MSITGSAALLQLVTMGALALAFIFQMQKIDMRREIAGLEEKYFTQCVNAWTAKKDPSVDDTVGVHVLFQNRMQAAAADSHGKVAYPPAKPTAIRCAVMISRGYGEPKDRCFKSTDEFFEVVFKQ